MLVIKNLSGGSEEEEEEEEKEEEEEEEEEVLFYVCEVLFREVCRFYVVRTLIK